MQRSHGCGKIKGDGEVEVAHIQGDRCHVCCRLVRYEFTCWRVEKKSSNYDQQIAKPQLDAINMLQHTNPESSGRLVNYKCTRTVFVSGRTIALGNIEQVRASSRARRRRFACNADDVL